MSTDDRPPLRPRFSAALIVTIFVFAAGFHLLGLFGWEFPDSREFVDGRLQTPKPAVTAIWLFALGIGLWSIRMPTRRRPERARLRTREPLCANCFETYVEGARVCPTCSRPLSWFANTGPYERVHAQAWILGQAANRPTHIAHVGVLTLFAVGAVLPLLAVVASMLGLGARDAVPGLALVPMTFHAWLWTAFARRAWRSWRRRPTEYYGTPPWWTRDEHWKRSPALPDGESDSTSGGQHR